MQPNGDEDADLNAFREAEGERVGEALYTGIIPGWKYQTDFITEEEEQALLKEIYAREEFWDFDRDNKRVQVYVSTQ